MSSEIIQINLDINLVDTEHIFGYSNNDLVPHPILENGDVLQNP